MLFTTNSFVSQLICHILFIQSQDELPGHFPPLIYIPAHTYLKVVTIYS